jgi:hypothetical protein
MKRRRKKNLRVAFLGTPSDIERLARMGAEYVKRLPPGAVVPRAVAAHAAMLVGLDKIEHDFGLPPLEGAAPGSTMPPGAPANEGGAP